MAIFRGAFVIHKLPVLKGRNSLDADIILHINICSKFKAEKQRRVFRGCQPWNKGRAELIDDEQSPYDL